MLEWLVLLALITSGHALARVSGATGWLVSFIAFPLGVSVFVAVGLVQIAVFAPTWPLLALLVSFSAVALIVALRWNRLHLGLRDLAPFLTTLGVGSVVFLGTRALNLVTWHTDSLFNIESSMLLADDEFIHVHDSGAAKRQIAIPLIHALSVQLGEGVYLETFAPMIALSILGTIWMLISARIGPDKARWGGLIAILAILVLASNNRFVFHAFYVNGHLYFAGLLLICAGFLWARASRLDLGASSSALVVVPMMLLPALTVTRPESALVIGLLVVVVWVLDLTSREKTLFTVVAGCSIAVWHARLSLIPLMAGDKVPVSSYGLLVLGVLLALSPLVLRRLPAGLLTKMPTIVEVGLWIALVVFIVRDPYIFAKSGRATFVNLVLGSGGWGFSLIALGLAGILALILYKGRSDLVLRYSLSTFIPLAFLLSYLRDGGYRIGDGDSLNRMWMQFVPLLLLFVVQRAFDADRRFRRLPRPSAASDSAAASAPDARRS